MALKIYISGNLETPGDNIGLTLASLNAVGTIQLRCDSGEVTAESVTVTAPTGTEVSADGVTYGATAVYAAGSIGDTDVDCYIKRTQASVTEDMWLQGTTTPHVSAVATEAAPAAPAAFTPTVSAITASGATVTFATTDINGDALTYKVAVTTNPTPPASWSGYADATSPKAVTGLSELTTYYAHVQASDGTFTTVGTSASFATGDTEAPVIEGTLTAVAGVGQVTLSGPTATDNIGIAKWQYRIGAGAWVDIASTSGTMPSTVVTVAAGAEYDFEVRALDAANNASATLSATSGLVLAFLDDFTTDGALDSALWATSTAGAGTAVKSGGKLVIDSPTTTDAIIAFLKAPVAFDTTRTYRTKFTVVDAATTYSLLLGISQRESVYPAVGKSVNGEVPAWANIAGAQGPYISLDYRLASGIPRVNFATSLASYAGSSRFNGVANAWQDGAASTVGKEITVGTEYVAELITDATGVVMRLYAADGVTVLVASTKRLWTEIGGYSFTKYLTIGDVFTDFHSGEVSHDYLMGW